MKFSEREPPMPIVNAWRLGMSDGTVRFSAYLSGGGLIPGRYSIALREADLARRAGRSALDYLVEEALAGRAKLCAWRGK